MSWQILSTHFFALALTVRNKKMQIIYFFRIKMKQKNANLRIPKYPIK